LTPTQLSALACSIHGKNYNPQKAVNQLNHAIVAFNVKFEHDDAQKYQLILGATGLKKSHINRLLFIAFGS
jgi:hypothetical protein